MLTNEQFAHLIYSFTHSYCTNSDVSMQFTFGYNDSSCSNLYTENKTQI